MKRIIFKYRSSKYRRFTGGLIFAVIAVIALALCQLSIIDNQEQMTVVIYFCIAVISMLMGFVAMFRDSKAPKQI
jgi:phosphomevalonate kinase